MGISRGIANIVTLGAVSKVDAAAESYRRTVSKYEEYRNLCWIRRICVMWTPAGLEYGSEKNDTGD